MAIERGRVRAALDLLGIPVAGTRKATLDPRQVHIDSFGVDANGKPRFGATGHLVDTSRSILVVDGPYRPRVVNRVPLLRHPS